MSPVLPGFHDFAGREDDIVLTPRRVARDVVSFFNPSGSILDPCKGEGAFLDFMPGADWCEIREGKDFFEWNRRVDWIVSNPPYSIFSKFLRKSFEISDNIVYLIPINKVFSSDKILREIYEWGGVKAIYYVGDGKSMNWPIGGYCIGAVYFKRNYKGFIEFSVR